MVLGRNDEAVDNARRSLQRGETRTAWMALAIALIRTRESSEEGQQRAARVRARGTGPDTGDVLEPMVRDLARTPADGERFIEAMR